MHCPVAISIQVVFVVAHAPADKAAKAAVNTCAACNMDVTATPAPQPRHRTCDEPKAKRKKARRSGAKRTSQNIKKNEKLIHDASQMGFSELAETGKGMAAHQRALSYAEKNVRKEAVEKGVQAEEVSFPPTAVVPPAVVAALETVRIDLVTALIIASDPEI